MHAVAGRLKAAADAAVAAAEAAPHDADAAGLAAIMLQLAGAIKADDMLVQQERAGLHVETVVGGGGGGGSGGGGEGDGVSSAGALHRAMRYQLAQLQADGSCGAALAGARAMEFFGLKYQRL